MNFSSTKKNIFILLSLSIIFIYSIKNIQLKEQDNSTYLVYSIVFNYYGMDSTQIEKLITIPLEEKLSSLKDLVELKSSCSFNHGTTTVYLNKSADKKLTYLNIRKITDDIYSTLPSDVQKPEIFSSDYESKSQFCICFDSDKYFIEKNIKPLIKSIDGVSEIKVDGGSEKQISIQFNTKKLFSMGLSQSQAASFIPLNDFPDLLSNYNNKNYCIPICLLDHFNSIDDFQNINIYANQNIIPFTDFSHINYSNKIPTELFLLNNKEKIFLNIKTSSDANLILISHQLNKIISSPDFASLNPRIIYDIGKNQKEILINAFYNLAFSLLITTLIVFLFYQSISFSILIILFFLLTLIFTTGTLSFLKLPLSSDSISGITISIGLISDILLVLFEQFKNSVSNQIFFLSLKKIRSAAISSSVTSIIAIIPLLFINQIINGISSIAISIILMLFYSTFISLVFFPSFLIYCKSNKKIFLIKIKTTFLKKLISISNIFLSHKKISSALFISLCIFPLIALIFINKNIDSSKNQNILYCSVEYNPEKNINSIQNELSDFLDSLNQIPQIEFIKTNFLRGKAEIEIIYKTLSEIEITKLIQQNKNKITNGFLYIPEIQNSRLQKPVSVKIGISGPEENQCRKYAKLAAELITRKNLSNQTVLNFSESETVYYFKPDFLSCSKNNLTARKIASFLREQIYGPVIHKSIIGTKEYDVKITPAEINSFSQINELNIPANSSLTNIKSLGKITSKKIPPVIYHLNTKPTAFFTIELNRKSFFREVKKISAILKSINLKSGYTFNYPLSIENEEKAIKNLTYILIFCSIFIFFFICAQNEKIILTSLIILSIPVSLFFPLLLKTVFNLPLQSGDILGMILLSGISVNNSIYLSESEKENSLEKLKSKLESITITTLTTLTGSLPVMLFSKIAFSKSLAFFMFWGTAGAFFNSLAFFPFLSEFDLNKKKPGSYLLSRS